MAGLYGNLNLIYSQRWQSADCPGALAPLESGMAPGLTIGLLPGLARSWGGWGAKRLLQLGTLNPVTGSAAGAAKCSWCQHSVDCLSRQPWVNWTQGCLGTGWQSANCLPWSQMILRPVQAPVWSLDESCQSDYCQPQPNLPVLGQPRIIMYSNGVIGIWSPNPKSWLLPCTYGMAVRAIVGIRNQIPLHH